MLPKSFLYFLEMNRFNILQNVVCTPLVILNLIFKGKTLTSVAGVHQHQPCLVWEGAFSAPTTVPQLALLGAPSKPHLDPSHPSHLWVLTLTPSLHLSHYPSQSPLLGLVSSPLFLHLFPRLTFGLNFHLQPPPFPTLPNSLFLSVPERSLLI